MSDNFPPSTPTPTVNVGIIGASPPGKRTLAKRQEVAAELGCSIRSVYELERAGKIESILERGRRLIIWASVDAYIDSLRTRKFVPRNPRPPRKTPNLGRAPGRPRKAKPEVRGEAKP